MFASDEQHVHNTEAPKDSTLLGLTAAPDQSTARRANETPLRFLVLFCATMFMFGNYYFYDQTSATEGAIRNQTGMSEDVFGLLSSVYSWPNVVLPFVGGLLVDKMGVRVAIVIFTGLVMLGSVLFTFGLMLKSSAILIVGRVIFGMGGESQCVVALTLISRWFRGKELAFSVAIIIAVSRLGSVAAFDSQPFLVEMFQIVGASGMGSALCIFSFVAAISASFLDRYGARRDAARGLTVKDGTAEDEVVRVQDIFKFGKLYWLLTLSCISVFVAAFPFMQVISAPYLEQRFGFDDKMASLIVSNINLVSALAAPLLGLVVDKCGWRPLLLVASAGTLCACHITFLLFPACDHCMVILLPYVIMGVGLSVYGGVIWPCVPLVVDPSTTGTAFGITTACQNLGMALSPMVLTKFHSDTHSFTLPFLYIIACCGTGILAASCVWIIDCRTGRKLWRP